MPNMEIRDIDSESITFDAILDSDGVQTIPVELYENMERLCDQFGLTLLLTEGTFERLTFRFKEDFSEEFAEDILEWWSCNQP